MARDQVLRCPGDILPAAPTPKVRSDRRASNCSVSRRTNHLAPGGLEGSELTSRHSPVVGSSTITPTTSPAMRDTASLPSASGNFMVSPAIRSRTATATDSSASRSQSGAVWRIHYDSPAAEASNFGNVCKTEAHQAIRLLPRSSAYLMYNFCK